MFYFDENLVNILFEVLDINSMSSIYTHKFDRITTISPMHHAPMLLRFVGFPSKFNTNSKVLKATIR